MWKRAQPWKPARRCRKWNSLFCNPESRAAGEETLYSGFVCGCLVNLKTVGGVAIPRFARDSQKLLLRPCILENAFGEIVVDLGIVTQDFIVRRAENLLTLAAQLVTDELLHLGIVQVALPGSFFAD